MAAYTVAVHHLLSTAWISARENLATRYFSVDMVETKARAKKRGNIHLMAINKWKIDNNMLAIVFECLFAASILL